MDNANILKETWIKVLEYATSPKQGTLSRKQRKGVSIRINNDSYDNGVLFLGDVFVRITENIDGMAYNTYYDWAKIKSIRTISKIEDDK
ncbi:MAG: hypothetical protein JW982_05940 [Spirochaetes bacterium]|nr:hypothetical protein [Spirochaetota bacterium]